MSIEFDAAATGREANVVARISAIIKIDIVKMLVVVIRFNL